MQGKKEAASAEKIEVLEGSPQSRFLIKKGVFYNPEMETCRDIFSLFAAACKGRLDVADTMCASGIRGLRYKIENSNVSSLFLSDLSKKAVACARQNAKANKVKCEIVQADACDALRENKGKFNFIELDPFGSPLPFLYDAIRSLEGMGGAILSATATDMAVLCGANHKACLKNYGAAPLDNEFCHENAVRILLGKISLIASQFNLGTRPLLSLSHKHYIKVAVQFEDGAESAVLSAKKIGYVSYCPACCWREFSRFPKRSECPHCSHQLEIGGPMHIGQIWESGILEKMLMLNEKRSYRNKAKIMKMLSIMEQESRIDAPGYYDLHVLAKKLHAKIKSMDEAIGLLARGGFEAKRTHFCQTAIRTNAPHDEVVGRLGK
jgi:tRNA (guanine26-N2/guanine27-N2)-dimethyltransferase